MSTGFYALDLAIAFNKKCEGLRLRYAQKDQLTRASLSIALNLTEGAGRFTPKEKRRFYRIAYGSLRECRTILAISASNTEASRSADHLGAIIWKLLQSLGPC